MKTKSLITLVVASNAVTLFLAGLLFFALVPWQMATSIKWKPSVFMQAIQVAAKKHQQTSQQEQMKKRFKNPVDISVEGRVVFGNSDAPITIVEYSDFQCPYCSKASATMKGLIKKYDGQVNVVYKHFPLSFHPLAEPAAVYYEAIANQSHKKAEKFHDVLFDDFSSYARLKDKAQIRKYLNKKTREVGASVPKVKKDYNKALKLVKADFQEGSRVGVQGTPTFFINGIKVGQEGFEPIIQRLLK